MVQASRLNQTSADSATTILSAVQARTFEYFSRAHPGLVQSWNDLLDMGQTEGEIAERVREAVVRAGRTEQQAYPFEAALRYLVEKRKGFLQ